MEPYVDWFGFMAYDLHGFWDADVKTLGKIIRLQTDIKEIDKGLLPLWFAGLDPAKVNFGLAYYGRSYTLSDPACPWMGCSFEGAGKPGACTSFEGVMSNLGTFDPFHPIDGDLELTLLMIEIRALIAEKNLVPDLIAGMAIVLRSYDTPWINVHRCHSQTAFIG